LPTPTPKTTAMAVRLSSVIDVISEFELPAPTQPAIQEQAVNTAKLINKFYERYPLETFAKETERAEALGYFMAGVELQRFGDFIVYEDTSAQE
ncbi:MAG: hypothetical protein RSA84_13470, partial [Acinetobacter sp.]